MKQCVLEERECIKCGECELCDLDAKKTCDNCMKCVLDDTDYAEIAIDEIITGEEKRR